jgi:hypothetical protein
MSDWNEMDDWMDEGASRFPFGRAGRLSTWAIVFLLITLVCMVSSFLLIYRVTGDVLAIPGHILDTVRSLFEPGEIRIVTQAAVLEQIKPLFRLQTEEDYLSTVVEATQHRTIFKIKEKLLLVACGRVIAGVDLDKLTKDDVQVDGDRVIIDLPEAEIFDVILDNDRECTYVHNRSVPLDLFLEADEDLDNIARLAAEENFEETALKNGILKRARRQAQEKLAYLLLLAGYEHVEFTESEILTSDGQE